MRPGFHPDGSPNAPAGLLRYLAGVLGLDEMMVHDLAAYAAAVAGHSAFTERFADEILTSEVRLPRLDSCCRVLVQVGPVVRPVPARQPSMGSLRYRMCRRPRRTL